MLLGVGLDSSEVGFPPEDFEGVFDLARDEGLHLVAHAGEEGPPEYVWGALDVLGVERIDHGNRALEDVIDRLDRHPLQAMLDRGLKVTLNSDDPSYFGGYIGDNYAAIQEALGLSDQTMTSIARNSIEASFLPPTEKTALLDLF